MIEVQEEKCQQGAVLRRVLPEELLKIVEQYNMFGVGCWAIFLSELGWWSSKIDELKAKANLEFLTYATLVTDCCNFVLERLKQVKEQEHPRVFLNGILSFLGREGFQYKELASFLDFFRIRPSQKVGRYLCCETISLFALDVYRKVVEALHPTPSHKQNDSFFSPDVPFGVIVSLNHQFNFFGRYLVDILTLQVDEKPVFIAELAQVTAIPSDQIYFMAFRELAFFYKGGHHNYEKALEITNEASEIYPSNPSFHLIKGEILQKSLRPEEAIAAWLEGYQLLLSEEPLRWDIENLRGAFEYQIAEAYYELGQYDKAFDWIQKAAQREPASIITKALPLKAEILMGLERNQEASDLLDSFVVLGLPRYERKNSLLII